MQDFYTHYADCNFPRPVDGNFDVFPRGTITYTGSSIDSNRITNRFVRARYLKLVDGKLESFTSFMYSIPLTIKFDCELWIDTQLTAFKLEQAIRESFYKTVTFYMYYKGMRLGATAGFSEDYNITKNIQYSFESDNRIKLTFNIEVETYQPVFDQSTEMRSNNRIKGFAYNIYEHDEKSYGSIFITNPSDNITVPKGYPLWIEWKSNKEGAVINKINAYWSLSNSSEKTLIESSVLNNEYYIWNIPSNFTTYKSPTIIYEEDSIIGVYKQPLVSIIPDLSTNMISVSSFNIIDSGQFIAPSRDCSIGILLEMKNDTGQISYSPDNYIYGNIIDYKLDSFCMLGDLQFPGTVNFKSIDLYITNTTNTAVESVIRNIKIV